MSLHTVDTKEAISGWWGMKALEQDLRLKRLSLQFLWFLTSDKESLLLLTFTLHSSLFTLHSPLFTLYSNFLSVSSFSLKKKEGSSSDEIIMSQCFNLFIKSQEKFTQNCFFSLQKQRTKTNVNLLWKHFNKIWKTNEK